MREKVYVVGLDVHLKNTQGTVMKWDGSIVKKERFPTTKKHLHEFLEDVPKGTSVALEALGFCWPWIDYIEELGYKAKLASPSKLRVIADTKIKTDKIDSEIIAHLTRMNWLPESYVPAKEFRKLRSFTRHRAGLRKMGTMCKNRIKSSLRKYGINAELDTGTIKGRKLAKSFGILEVDQNVDLLGKIEELIKYDEKILKEIHGDNEIIEILQSIPGIGLVTALGIYAEVCDIRRFPHTDKFAHYCSLVPSTKQSGEKTHHGRILKVNKWLKWIIIEATWVHVIHCPESRITKAYKSAYRRKKNKNKAIIVAARKMVNVIYHLWKNREKFNVDA
jgi:transposase